MAEAMGEDPLGPEDVGLADSGWDSQTPLWFWVLREAAVRGDGERLGPVGGRIVAEVLLGILDADPSSYRAMDPAWRPSLPARDGSFALTDILVPVD